MVSFLLRFAFFLACCAGILAAETTFVLQADLDIRICIITALCTLLAYNAYLLIGEARYSLSLFSHSNGKSRLVIIILSGLLLLLHLAGSPEILPYFFIALLPVSIYFLRLLPAGNTTVPAIAYFLKPLWLALIWSFVTVYFSALSTATGVVNLFFIQRLLLMLLICLVFEKRDWMKATDESARSNKRALFWSTYFILAWMLFMGYTCWFFHDCPVHLAAYWITGVVIVPVYFRAGKVSNRYYYSLLTDGLMLLPFLLTQFHRFWLTCHHN